MQTMMMQNAMMMAAIFGPLLMIKGIWMLFYHGNMVKVCSSMKSTPGLFYVWGVINMIVGLTVINQFSMWTMTLSVLVTLFGWVALLRGVAALFLPQMLVKCTMSDPNWMKVKGIIPLVWGFGMCWFAFWMQ
ncbi:MAG: hypothetical protein HYX67_08155 [Candidatus Melainabacteria bacterium]|nr:hypothetical protein [Candidatus Melainabacteria bacterium]